MFLTGKNPMKVWVLLLDNCGKSGCIVTIPCSYFTYPPPTCSSLGKREFLLTEFLCCNSSWLDFRRAGLSEKPSQSLLPRRTIQCTPLCSHCCACHSAVSTKELLFKFCGTFRHQMANGAVPLILDCSEP